MKYSFAAVMVLSAAAVAQAKDLPQVRITRHLGHGATHALVLRCPTSASASQPCLLWQQYNDDKGRIVRLPVHHATQMVESFFRRLSKKGARTPSSTDDAILTWEITWGEHMSKGMVSRSEQTHIKGAANMVLTLDGALRAQLYR